MSSVPCPVDGCSKDVHRKGFCYAHYMKNWRYGTPTPKHEVRRQLIDGQRFGLLVALEPTKGKWLCRCDCGATKLVRTGDLNRGSTTSCGQPHLHHRLSSVTYGAAHDRLKIDKGNVRDQECVDCGDEAKQWSYDHADPNEMLAYGLSPKPIAYSLNPEHYSARCVPCHKHFDLNRKDAYLLD